MLKAKDIMTSDVHTVSPETSIEDLAKIFVDTNVNALPVVEDGKLFGQVSQNDLVERDQPLHIPTVISIFDWVIYLESDKTFREEVRKMAARTVRDICRTGVPTCDSETPVSEIAALMSGKSAHLVPVVENERVVGVVGRLDIIRSMG
jgi:CBS-domain-containing membrane protein